MNKHSTDTAKVFKIRLKKGDIVMVRAGKEKGKTGKVVATHPTLNKVTVEGINVVKRHVKPTQLRPQGGIKEITKPVWVSKVGLVHPEDKTKTSRIGYQVNDKGEKVRIYKSNSKEIK
jgi:large subunit ribosomal protein L24